MYCALMEAVSAVSITYFMSIILEHIRVVIGNNLGTCNEYMSPEYYLQLLRHIRDFGCLPQVVSQRIFLLVLIYHVIIGHQWNFADIGRQHIHRLCQAGGMPTQRVTNQLGTLLYRSTEMIDSRSRFTIKDIVRTDPDPQQLLVQLLSVFM